MSETFTVEHQVQVPENTILRARLNELEVKVVQFTDRQTGQPDSFKKLNWVFEITEGGEFLGLQVRGETKAFLSDHPDNQFRKFAEALLQRELGMGAQISPDDLVGLPCLITVKYEADRKDSSRKFRRVDTVMAVEGGAQQYSQEPPF